MAADYCLTCTPGRVANRHGNCTRVAVDTVVLGKFRAACISKITVEITAFLPYSLRKKRNIKDGISVVLQP